MQTQQMLKLIDRVESKKAERVLTFIRFAIVALVLIPLAIVLKNYEHVGSLRLSNFSQFFLGLFLLINFHIKFAKKKGQFIQWSENEIVYKTKETEGVIQLPQIKSIDIHIDCITVTLVDEVIHRLDIEDFTDYEVRLRIKENFSKITGG